MKKIAYLILAHTDPEHFFSLINALGSNCDIYIHVDLKINISAFIPPKKLNNVHFIDKRFSVSWAGISMIDAEIELIKTALYKSMEYTHLVFLSGSCYPIKPFDYINSVLMSNPKKEWIKFFNMRESPRQFNYMNHVLKKWFQEPIFLNSFPIIKQTDKILRKILTITALRNSWPLNITPYYGSQWFALTVDCCQYILDFHTKNPWYREINKYSFAPDEHYIHTVIGNSPFLANSDGIQPFKGKGTWRMANLHIIDPSLSKWFTINDWEEIRTSNKMFVRKVRSLDGVELVRKIDDLILAKHD